MLKIGGVAAPPSTPVLTDNYGMLVVKWSLSGRTRYKQWDIGQDNDVEIMLSGDDLTISGLDLLGWDRWKTGDQDVPVSPEAVESLGHPVVDREQFEPNPDLHLTKDHIITTAPLRLRVKPETIAIVMSEEMVTRWLSDGPIRFGLTAASDPTVIEIDRSAIPVENPLSGIETQTPEVMKG